MKKQFGAQLYIKIGIVLALVAIIAGGSFLFNKHQKQKQIEAASTLYESMLQSLRQKDTRKAMQEAQILSQQYARTPYAPLAGLMLARFSLEKSDTKTAIEQFKQAIQSGENTPLEHIARIRLARVLLGDEQYEEAFNVLQVKAPPEGYISLYEETKGDIYLKQNQVEKAKEAYSIAIKAVPAGVPVNALQLKYNDLIKEKEGT